MPHKTKYNQFKMKKILFLEDEEVVGKIYKKNLEKKGFKVDWVRSSSEVLELINKNSYDVVALDHRLSEKATGLDLIKPVRDKLPKAKIVMLSNYSEFQLAKEARVSGADDYLVKLNTTPESFIEYIKSL